MISKLSSLLYHCQLRRFRSIEATIASRAVICRDRFPNKSYMELSQSFYEAMKHCGCLRSVPQARKIHGQLISSGLYSSLFLRHHLLGMYSNCCLFADACRIFDEIDCKNIFIRNTMVSVLGVYGRIHEARKLFEEMSERDSVSWNSMMSAYYLNKQPEETIRIFMSMIRDRVCMPDTLSFSSVLKACGCVGSVGLALQLHGIIVKFSYINSLCGSLLDMYIKCGAEDLGESIFMRMQRPSLFCWNSMIHGYSKSFEVQKALDLFNLMPERDQVSWNTIISALSEHGRGDESLCLFVEMYSRGFRPNSVTYASVLSASASVSDLIWGMHLHARIIQSEPDLDGSLACGLIDMYAKCGHLEIARRVFDCLNEPNVVAWTCVIAGYAQFGFQDEALAFFKKMMDNHIPLDEFTIATALGLCCNHGNKIAGIQLHSYAIKSGMDSSIPVGNAIVTTYAKSGDIQEASRAFELMPARDIISWTAMMTAFSQIGNVEKTRVVFNEMSGGNVITWNLMISTYTQRGFAEEGLKLYCVMRRKGVKPDGVTFASSISACANLATLTLGEQIVCQSQKLGFFLNVSVANTVVSMYSRCGEVEDARKVFDYLPNKNLISWNSMMAGYAQNGQGGKAIEIFEAMIRTDCAPDHISYASVLSGCSHSGLVPEARHYFVTMSQDFGISPTYEHYSSMVNLYGRAGLFKEALDFINEMGFEPGADIWLALLGSCRIHRNATLAEYSMKKLIDLDLTDSGSYVLVANTCSNAGEVEDVANVRKLMREKGVRKNPGCSWIEINNRVHVFTVDDTNHPQAGKIYEMLTNISETIGDRGE